jgi:hypothetical protein
MKRRVLGASALGRFEPPSRQAEFGQKRTLVTQSKPYARLQFWTLLKIRGTSRYTHSPEGLTLLQGRAATVAMINERIKQL